MDDRDMLTRRGTIASTQRCSMAPRFGFARFVLTIAIACTIISRDSASSRSIFGSWDSGATCRRHDLKRLTDLDFKNHVGLAATLLEHGRERIIGVGRYICGADPHRAEVAFAVLDEFQGHGIGTLLLEHLGLIADANGVAEFEADVLGENRQMLEVFAHMGFESRRSLDSGVVRLRSSTRKTLEK